MGPSGQSFTITWGTVVRHIKLDTMRSLVVSEAEKLTANLKAIIPTLDISDFSLDKIKDNWTDARTSLFDLEEEPDRLPIIY